jgi:glutathione synthase/RimK-type ligase-like ATP-grasp enzyme
VILIWGIDDAPVRLLRVALDAIGAPFLFVNHNHVAHVYVDLEYTNRPGGVIVVEGIEHDVEAFCSIYVRPHDFRDLPAFAGRKPDDPRWQHARHVQTVLWNFVDLAEGLVVNRPSSMLSNGSKPWQSRLIAEHGFDTPATLITTDAAALREFRELHPAVIYKSISGTRSIVSELGRGHEARLDDLRWCPTQFQELVDGDDYRVHVVGGRVFASRVVSNVVDYRYGPSRMEAFTLPDEVADRCVSLSRTLGLAFAGIDLKQSADGRWWCFEVNPAPGYSAYEEVTGQPISAALADLLVHGEPG